MKALTICQPYTELICRRLKFVENRTWETLYRGPLAIHAGKSRSWLCLSVDGLRDRDYEIPVAEMPFGAVVAVAHLADCLHISKIRENATRYVLLNEHEHARGPFCWVLENVVRLPEPVPARGAQGLWEWDAPDDIKAMVRERIGAI